MSKKSTAHYRACSDYFFINTCHDIDFNYHACYNNPGSDDDFIHSCADNNIHTSPLFGRLMAN
jgi:hypothetical protein